MCSIFETIGQEILLNAKRISQALSHRETEGFGIGFQDTFIFLCQSITICDLFSNGLQFIGSADIFLITN
jgi:hypothetical protein